MSLKSVKLPLSPEALFGPLYQKIHPLERRVLDIILQDRQIDKADFDRFSMAEWRRDHDRTLAWMFNRDKLSAEDFGDRPSEYLPAEPVPAYHYFYARRLYVFLMQLSKGTASSLKRNWTEPVNGPKPFPSATQAFCFFTRQSRLLLLNHLKS